jgi:hypothetical protein
MGAVASSLHSSTPSKATQPQPQQQQWRLFGMDYPRFRGIGFVPCSNTASAEVTTSDDTSLLIHVNVAEQSQVFYTQAVERIAQLVPGGPVVPGARHASSKPLTHGGTVSLEARYFFPQRMPGTHCGGFMSARVGTSGNIGVALGHRDLDNAWCVPRLGVCYNWRTHTVQPFFGIAIEWNM